MIDFEKEFSGFVGSGEGSAIKDIYSIIPSMSQEQLKIVSCLDYYIKKYDLQDLKEILEQYLSQLKINKNLSFVKSMNVKALLKAYTQEELIKGINVSSTSSSRGDV